MFSSSSILCQNLIYEKKQKVSTIVVFSSMQIFTAVLLSGFLARAHM